MPDDSGDSGFGVEVVGRVGDVMTVDGGCGWLVMDVLLCGNGEAEVLFQMFFGESLNGRCVHNHRSAAWTVSHARLRVVFISRH